MIQQEHLTPAAHRPDGLGGLRMAPRTAEADEGGGGPGHPVTQRMDWLTQGQAGRDLSNRRRPQISSGRLPHHPGHDAGRPGPHPEVVASNPPELDEGGKVMIDQATIKALDEYQGTGRQSSPAPSSPSPNSRARTVLGVHGNFGVGEEFIETLESKSGITYRDRWARSCSLRAHTPS